MKNMKVFLILQKQLEELHQQNKILSASIQRIEQKQWFPLFTVIGGDGAEICCSLRVQSEERVRKGEGVRTWADLRLLAEFMRDKLGIQRCELILTDFELPEIGATNENTL
ncbi:transcriptional regulator [Pseudomonas syringae pv. actinidiae]|nr:transcriptional regulator [Pseudomonas syringae pv. actinidiae]